MSIWNEPYAISPGTNWTQSHLLQSGGGKRPPSQTRTNSSQGAMGAMLISQLVLEFLILLCGRVSDVTLCTCHLVSLAIAGQKPSLTFSGASRPSLTKTQTLCLAGPTPLPDHLPHQPLSSRNRVLFAVYTVPGYTIASKAQGPFTGCGPGLKRSLWTYPTENSYTYGLRISGQMPPPPLWSLPWLGRYFSSSAPAALQTGFYEDNCHPELNCVSGVRLRTHI